MPAGMQSRIVVESGFSGKFLLNAKVSAVFINPFLNELSGSFIRPIDDIPHHHSPFFCCFDKNFRNGLSNQQDIDALVNTCPL